jgi:hypothetical protein
MTTYLDKLAAIINACVAANPDIARSAGERPRIRLTDAQWLLMEVPSDKHLERDLLALSCWWNLAHDALDLQSNECVGFIYDRMTRDRFSRE